MSSTQPLVADELNNVKEVEYTDDVRAFTSYSFNFLDIKLTVAINSCVVESHQASSLP